MRVQLGCCSTARVRDSPEVNAAASLSPPANVDPAFKRKVDALRAIEAKVEARVVAPGKGDHKLPRMLNQVIRATERLGEFVGRSEIRLVPKKLVAVLPCPGE